MTTKPTEHVRAASRPDLVAGDDQDGRAERTSDTPSAEPQHARDLAPQATPASPDDASDGDDQRRADQIMRCIARSAVMVAWAENSTTLDDATRVRLVRLRTHLEETFPGIMEHARSARVQVIGENHE